MIMRNKGGTMGYSWLILAGALSLSGCAAFRSGETQVSRNELRAMLADKTIRPFSDIIVTWKNFPYKTAIDIVGEGTLAVSSPKKPAGEPVPEEDLDRFRERAKRILAEAGLYSPEKGSGTLKLEMTTINWWTYRELWRGFLVDTAFIFIIPASLKTGYNITASFKPPEGAAVKVEEKAQRKTFFHLLLAPLYPLFTPGASENGLVKNMLWKISTDLHAKMKTAAVPPAAESPAPAAAPQEPAAQAVASPAAAAPQEAAPPVQPAPAVPAPRTTPERAGGTITPEDAPADDD